MIEHFRDDFAYGGKSTKLDLCIEALGAVEWIYTADGDWVYCPWCKAEWYSNMPEHWVHGDDCLRQRALR